MTASLGSALFLVVAPGSVAVLLPWWLSGWRFDTPFFGLLATRGLGLVLIAAGVFVLLESFIRFALVGLGTPAPIAPPTHLVVSGLYRHVRNPMYVAVVSLILGQAFFFGNLELLVYGLLVWGGFHVFVVAYEEPKLRDKFGAEYETFCAQVRRWLPRVRPWRG